MNAKAKIRLESIEQAHRTLDALPQHCPEELTKTQAIHKLIVPRRRSAGDELPATDVASGRATTRGASRHRRPARPTAHVLFTPRDARCACQSHSGAGRARGPQHDPPVHAPVTLRAAGSHRSPERAADDFWRDVGDGGAAGRKGPDSSKKSGVTDGFRTRDIWSHNPVLYQLSYGHRAKRRRP